MRVRERDREACVKGERERLKHGERMMDRGRN